MFDKIKVKQFRTDFQLAVAQLEKDYNVSIGLGTIRYDGTELRAKMTAAESNGTVEKIATSTKTRVGDIVSINHKKVNAGDMFTVIKVNKTTVKVQKITSSELVGAFINVSHSLLVKS